MIRYANELDIYKIANIYEDAKVLFAESGYYQWKGQYPNIDNVINDLKNNKILVSDNGVDICATLTMVYNEDLNYRKIEGKWLNDNKYVSIHRNATNSKYYHLGKCTELFKEAEIEAIKNNIYDIRIDTHKENFYMQKMLEKLGYIKCGIITLLERPDLTDNLRIAYQKHLGN